MVSEAAHELAIRGESGEMGATYGLAAEAVALKMADSSGLVTATSFKPTGTVGTVGGTAVHASTAQQDTTKAFSSSAAEPVQSQSADPNAGPPGVSVPISTQTALSTIYSIWTSEDTAVRETSTTTATVTVKRPVPTSEPEVCSVSTATETVFVYITVSPVPVETVTDEASTATLVNTDLSLTHRLPDVTLSGKPSTQTAVQTDVSLTRGLPDATVSGNPETQTDVRTDVSLTSGLPDATVTGVLSTVSAVRSSTAPGRKTVSIFTTVVITDFWGPPAAATSSSSSAAAAVPTTYPSAILTVTISDFYGPFGGGESKSDTSTPGGASSLLGAAGTEPSSTPWAAATATATMTWISGPAGTSGRAPGTNGTAVGGPSWSATASAPVVVSAGGRKPEPKGWGSGRGCGSFGCTVMLIAMLMLAL
ncbi:hypothetical protein CDD83_691 [Cordyceps sp. RAO-2017]|nr:hypothetical protein CDD83_691 [Cordyceps sp. RAO-2017]